MLSKTLMAIWKILIGAVFLTIGIGILVGVFFTIYFLFGSKALISLPLLTFMLFISYCIGDGFVRGE